MSKPIRIQLSRRSGFDLQKTSLALNGLPAANVARPTLFGNPFIHDDAAVAVEAFARYCQGGTKSFEMGPGTLQFAKKIHTFGLHHAWPEWLREKGLPAIKGHNLACWCKPDAPCHADVLLRLANPTCDEVAA